MSEADPKLPTETILTEEVAAEPRRRRSPWRLVIMLSVPILLLAVGGYFWLTSGRYVSTDNAYVQQDMVSVAPEVTGIVGEVFVHENQPVHRGDLLFRLDQRPFRIALEQAEAQMASAQVQVAQLRTQTAGTVADIAGAENNLAYAQREFERYAELLRRVGYLMRTTAVYGNGKFGIADRARIAERPELAGPFRAEMLTIYLIRCFTLDLVEHVARHRGGGRFVPLEPRLKRHLGIGNATGLGMAPFLASHPILIHNWMQARETALARVRSIALAEPRRIERLAFQTIERTGSVVGQPCQRVVRLLAATGNRSLIEMIERCRVL